MGNYCCQPKQGDMVSFEADNKESHLWERRDTLLPGGFLDVHEHKDMSIGIPSPDAASSPLGKLNKICPSGRSIKVEETQPISLTSFTGRILSNMTSITAYENLDGNYPLPPPKEFIDKVPELMWRLFKKHAGFKFRLEEYPGSDNPVEFSKDDVECRYFFGQFRKVLTNSTLMEGRGFICLIESQFYAGYLANDLPDGPGVMVYKDGSYFRGIWKAGSLNGFGIYYGPDGRTYKGNWVNNLQEGYGVETWRDSRNSYSGYFKRGKRCGQGSLTIGQDGTSYKGEFDENVLSGKGLFKWPDGKYFDGYWKNDRMHGKGVFKWPDGREYEGEYKDGKKEGYGIFRWPDGKRYEGYWKRGLQNGQGSLIEPDGTKRAGFWVNGIKNETSSLSTASPGFKR